MGERSYKNESTAVDEQFVREASDEAITLAQSLAVDDYARNQPSDVRVERRGSLRDMLNVLKGAIEKGYRWAVG